jgi:hypothetical protein
MFYDGFLYVVRADFSWILAKKSIIDVSNVSCPKYST